MLHAHFGSESRDCDGKSNDGKDIDASKFGDGFSDKYEFTQAMLKWLYRTPDSGPVHIIITDIGDNYDDRLVITMNMTTEEGFYSAGVTICQDDDFEESYSGYRDHTAESMGY